jgi:flagellum-specific peptidoglycan hydrolase FlgJ
MRESKIPASITLAQGILESGSGRGRLSVEGNNHFGIKCHGWTGKKIYHDDDASQECFRKYDHANSSFEDHSKFLTGRGRYAKLFKLRPGDYKGWAKGLRAAGYATDRKYPEKLISLIKRYNLDKYDDMVLGNKSVIEAIEIKHIVTKGDTLYSLSKKYHTTVEELKRLNRLDSNEISLGQLLIIKSN